MQSPPFIGHEIRNDAFDDVHRVKLTGIHATDRRCEVRWLSRWSLEDIFRR